MRALPLGIAALGLLLALKLTGASDALTAQAEEPAAAPPAAAAPIDAPPPVAAPAADGPTASESDVLERLADRRKQLDQRERDLDMREKLIAAAEKRVEERITELKVIEGRIETMFGRRGEQEESQLASLVKMYETMKPASAAAIFNTLEQGVLIDVMARMKPAKAAPILAAMRPDRAQDVTVELARRFDLPPETVPAAAAPPGG